MTDRAKNSFSSFVELVRRSCDKLYPGIGRYDRVVYGRVVRVFTSSGRVTEGAKLWSVDIEILGSNLAPDPRRGIIKDVPLDPVEVSDDGRALFPVVFVGTIVRMGWMYADRSLPYIVSITAEGLRLPDGSSGQLSSVIGDLLEILSRMRDSAAGPAVMRAQDLIEFQRILASLPGRNIS